MDFAVCTKKGYFKYYTCIDNEYLEFFHFSLNHCNREIIGKYNIDEDEYWKRIDEEKKYKLEFIL